MIKKYFMLGMIICAANSVFATDSEEFDIHAITPIKNGMNSDERREAIQTFLKEALTVESELTGEVCSSQKRQAAGGGRFFDTYTLTDGSEWVMGQGGLNRFLGYVYLKKAVEHYGFKKLKVVETVFTYRKPEGDITINIYPEWRGNLKNIPVIDSDDFFSLSRYVGDERLTYETVDEDTINELSILSKKIGFTDILGYANLRKKDGTVYIIDTEYDSFSNPFDSHFEGEGDLSFTFSRSLD